MRALALFLFLALPAAASLTLTDRYGHVLSERRTPTGELRTPIALDAVSPWVVLTTLAAEDKRFYLHSGVDAQATLRALWQNTRGGRIVSGGSTVTQQLVRLMEPRPRTLRGKLKEAWGALRLEQKRSKREILEAYLNQVPYGGRYLGIEAAAQGYFRVPARDLSLAQAALLAGIPQSPSRYHPVRFPDAALKRQQRVLDRLRDAGWIDAAAYQRARREPIRVLPQTSAWVAPHFTQSLGEIASERIKTTLDKDLQENVEGLLRTHLARLRAHQVSNGAVLVLDNASGEVLAWAGSADFFDQAIQGQVDGVLARRQPGSALKPFVYAEAFAQGTTPAEVIDDKPVFLGGFMPRNYDERWHGPVRLREALACSYNVPAVLLAQRLGTAVTLDTLRRFGLTSLDQDADFYGLGVALGNGEVTLLELTNAYAALARGGIWKPVQRMPGRLSEARRVMDRESVYQVTHVLSDNDARARAFGLNSPFHLPFAFAAKTGTTKDYRDNWAIGYTPGWTVGVWVGNFNGEPMRRVSGITGAAPLLRDIALVMDKRFGSRPFSVPRGIRELDICPESGLLVEPSCPTRMKEVFSEKHLPTTYCAMHRDTMLSTPTPLTLHIEFPAHGDVFRLNPRMPREAQSIRLRASEVHGQERWWVDGKEVQMIHGAAWWTLQPGRHRVRLSQELNGKRRDASPVVFDVIR